MNRKSIIHKITILTMFALIGHLLVGCTSNSTGEEDQPKRVSPTGSHRRTPVRVSIARKGTFYYRVACNGDIRAATTYQVSAQIPGVIQSCNARDGARFKKGDLILKLATTPLQLQLQTAQSALKQAESEYKSRLLGYRSLLKGKSPEEIKAIKEKLQTSSGVSQAKLEVKNADWNLQQAIIRAPASGVTANVKVSRGMQVNPGDPLFTLYTANDLLADVLILEEDAGEVAAGQKATVTPIGDQTKTYPAVVEGINPMVDKNGMVTAHLKLEKSGKLFPGMHVSAVIKVPKKEAVTVPKSALVLRSGERPVVFTVNDSLAKWHYVTPGLDNGKEVEILKGITPGDTVVTSNNIQLAHDAPVQIEDTGIISN